MPSFLDRHSIKTLNNPRFSVFPVRQRTSHPVHPVPAPNLTNTSRIMLEPSEVVVDEGGGLSATLPAIDSRTAHVRGVLKVEDGESVRVGVVNAGR